MVTESQYQYGFEIEDILKQFFALIDKSVVLRYEKVENERRLVQTITPTYKFATKSRTLLLLMNGAKNFTLPCVICQVTGIQADKDRLAAKKGFITRHQGQSINGYQFPTPITISLSLNIVTKYKTDLFQIYGNLCTLFQPECFISWIVPSDIEKNGVEELRNKVEWDFNLDIESKETLKEEEEDRFIGKMSFKIQGWIFRNPKRDILNRVLDIGTTALVTNELENRLDGLIDTAQPLTSLYGKVYDNPREIATSHIRILKAFVTVPINKNYYNFRIQNGNYDQFNLQADREYFITFDGYNFKDAKALLVPKSKTSLKQSTITFNEDFSKVSPKIGESEPKTSKIKGIPLETVLAEQNRFIVKLPKISYNGNFDIILYDTIDYDSFNDAEGFCFTATK